MACCHDDHCAGWPDVIVAAVMDSLGLWGGCQIVVHTRDELRSERPHHAIVAGE